MDQKKNINTILALIIIILSTIACGYNSVITHYPGNNYFPPETAYIYISILLMYLGFSLLSGKNSIPAVAIKEYIYFLFIMSIVALATYAVQYSPFQPIDLNLIAFERYFPISITNIIEWTASYRWFRLLLEFCYATLPYQMSILPVVVIASWRFDLLREYYFLMLSSTLIGFGFYYFFPTTGPASVLNSPLFADEQLATGLKFYQIHHYIKPTTMEGGLISLPSFHVIWAWLCLYLIRPWRIAFSLLLIINSLLTLACVFLGWHYFIDLFASLILLILLHLFYKHFIQDKTQLSAAN